MIYSNNTKYWDTLPTYHTSKIWNSPFYYLLMCLKYFCMFGEQYRPGSDTAFCGVWAGSTLFAKAYLSQYIKGYYGICELILKCQSKHQQTTF